LTLGSVGTGAGAALGRHPVDQSYLFLAVIGFAVIGILAVIHISRRARPETDIGAVESPFATSTEGMKRCPHCGTGNLVTDSTCSNCGKRLPG
jgi:hypothetical protein